MQVVGAAQARQKSLHLLISSGDRGRLVPPYRRLSPLVTDGARHADIAEVRRGPESAVRLKLEPERAAAGDSASTDGHAFDRCELSGGTAASEAGKHLRRPLGTRHVIGGRRARLLRFECVRDRTDGTAAPAPFECCRPEEARGPGEKSRAL